MTCSNRLIVGRRSEYGPIVITELISYQRTFSTWLYQFWYYSFKTAKHWGRGPATWTSSNLWPEDLSRFSPSYPSRSPTPSQVYNTPSTAAQAPNANKRLAVPIPEPTALCQWSIYIYQTVGVDSPEEDNHFQVPNETGGEWHPVMFNTPFEQKLQQSLETNSFSAVDRAILPVSAMDIAKAVKQSPEELFKQSFAFAMIGRNVPLVEQLCERARIEKIDLSDIHPYHLATTHLDGARSCCQILRLIQGHLGNKLPPNVLGPAGYTVLHNLMIAILRNH
jgi:hypothetical protein